MKQSMPIRAGAGGDTAAPQDSSPRPSRRRRIVVWLSVAASIACAGLAALLIIDRPINIHLGSRVRIFYFAGSIGCDVRSGEPVQGPREDISYGDVGAYVVNFREVENWRQQLSRAKGWGAAGVSFSHRYTTTLGDDRQWSAQAYNLVVTHAEYLIALTGVLAASAFVAYLKIRRREKRIASGLCAECGYDLRASGERCPECGAPRLLVVAG